MAIDRNSFFAATKPLFASGYSSSQKQGTNAILDEWESREPNGDPRWLAYMLATAYHETNQQMQPVREAYWLSEAWRQSHLSYYPYYGRGYVQLTHRDNYQKAGGVVHVDLVADPDKALDPNIAAVVMFQGMTEGWFRASADGRRHTLARYFSASTDDPAGARAIINGKEIKKVNGVKVLIAKVIASYYEVFLHGITDQAVGLLAAGLAAPTAAAPIAAAALAAGFAQRTRSIASDEWDFFGRQTYDIHGAKDHAGHTEGEDGWYQRVGQYWEVGTNTHHIDGRNHDWYWSATFISWVARQSGAADRFRYSTMHSVYISQGIRDFLAKRAQAGYWTMRLNEAKPEVGDIVCWGREAGVDYDHQKGGNYAGHSDFVVAVEAAQIWIIGGNVGNSVTRRPLQLNAGGFLVPVVQNGENLFGIMKNRLG